MRIRGQANKGNLTIGVHCLLIKRKTLMNCFFLNCRQHYAHRSGSCWGTSTSLTPAGKAGQQSETPSGQFLSPGYRRSRGIALLDLLLTNTDNIIGRGSRREVRIAGSLGCSAHALTDFMISKTVVWARSEVKTFNFKEKKTSPV